MINKNNKIIQKDNILKILNTFLEKEDFIDINDIYLYQTAFKNKSYIKEEKITENSNETLETLGDSILGCIIVEYLEERFYYENEGFISKLKMDITKTQGLEYFAKYLNFQEYVLISSEDENTILKFSIDTPEIPGRENPSILENCFEAFIGSLFTDHKRLKNSGYAYDVCKKFLVSLLENLISFSDIILSNDNYKNIIQNYFHSRKWTLPTYSLLYSEKDEKDRKIYTVGIYISRYILTEQEITKILYEFRNTPAKIIDSDKILVGIGSSYTTKNADQLSAKKFIEMFCPEKLELNLQLY